MTKIGIIGEMDREIKTLKTKLTDTKIIKKADMEFHEGNLNGVSVVVVQGGVGKVNAAICTQILVDVCNVTHIINTGVAGALNLRLEIGDIIIAKDTLQHDIDITALGYNPGEVPEIGTIAFHADEHMIEVARDACARVCPDVNSMYGRIASGDQFISDSAVKDRLVGVFQGDCVEMAGAAAVAQCAYLNKVPYVIIRAMSDKADGSAEMNFPLFQRIASERNAKLVEDMVQYI